MTDEVRVKQHIDHFRAWRSFDQLGLHSMFVKAASHPSAQEQQRNCGCRHVTGACSAETQTQTAFDLCTSSRSFWEARGDGSSKPHWLVCVSARPRSRGKNQAFSGEPRRGFQGAGSVVWPPLPGCRVPGCSRHPDRPVPAGDASWVICTQPLVSGFCPLVERFGISSTS